MFRVIPKSAILNHAILIITQLKWAWDFVLYQSFFQPRQTGLQQYADNLTITRYTSNIHLQESDECAVCLCKIDDGDEITELRCDHVFHKVCLDRWLGYGHVTCPLCRNNVKPPQFTAELRQELILINFAAVGSSNIDRETWWLRWWLHHVQYLIYKVVALFFLFLLYGTINASYHLFTWGACRDYN